MPDVAPLRTGDPEQVAGHRLAGRIGSGGQGVVYLGISALGEHVAVKMLRVEDERSREQFAKEVAAARRVAPFCTAQILDFDLEAQPPYVISEFIEGPSLQQYVEAHGPLSGTRLQRLAIGTATALAAIHQAGVVHRDMKPANVMMSPEGPRVIDFGIARDLSNDTTKISKLFGTPAYMSPEQLRGERIGPSTDLFAWGSVMTFAATGRAPFEAPHMMAAINKIAHEEPDLSGVPPELLAVLRQCFSKDPAYRPTAQHALSMLLGRPEDVNPPNSTVVLAEATQLVESTTTGPTESYATGETPLDPDVHPTEVHRPATVAQTRVERPQATSVEEGPTVRNPNPGRLRPPRPTGTTGPVSPGIPSGDIPPWGTPAAANANPPRPTPASRAQRPNQNPSPAAAQTPGQYSPPVGQPSAGSPQSGWGAPPSGQIQPGQGNAGPGQFGAGPSQSGPQQVGQGQAAQRQAGQDQAAPGRTGQTGQRDQGQAGKTARPQPGQGQTNSPQPAQGQTGWQQAGQRSPQPGLGKVPSGPVQPGSGQPSADQSQPEIPIWGQPSTRSRPPGNPASPKNRQPGTAHQQGLNAATRAPQVQNPAFPNPSGQNPIQAPQAPQQRWSQPPNPQLPNPQQPNSRQQGWGQPSSTPAPNQRTGNSGPAAPPNATGWNQPWGGGQSNAPTQIPTPSQNSPKSRRPLVLGVVAVVLAIVVGAGVWKAVSNVSSSGGGYSSPSGSSEKGAKTDNSGSCSDLLNAGADGTCTSGSSKGSTDNSSSSKSDSSEDDSGSSSKVAAAGTLPYPLEGVWEGDISQPLGAVQNWEVRLDLKGGKKKPGTMEIKELGCSSNVTVENAGYSTARLRVPVLNKNNPDGACAKLGEVILVQDPADPDTLTFTWRDLTNAGNIATGEVERAD